MLNSFVTAKTVTAQTRELNTKNAKNLGVLTTTAAFANVEAADYRTEEVFAGEGYQAFLDELKDDRAYWTAEEVEAQNKFDAKVSQFGFSV